MCKICVNNRGGSDSHFRSSKQKDESRAQTSVCVAQVHSHDAIMKQRLGNY